MTIEIVPKVAVSGSDDPAYDVSVTETNDGWLKITQAGERMLGKVTSGAGATTELTGAQVLAFAGAETAGAADDLAAALAADPDPFPQYLTEAEADALYDPLGGGGGALNDLSDVVISSPATGEVLKYNGTNWINDDDAGGSGGRELLTANRTYYVRTDGSDSNTGLVNNAGGAFLTLQKAWDVAVTLDLGGFALTIQVGNGTYTAGIIATKPVIGGLVSILGDTTTPANVHINSASPLYPFYAENGATFSVRGFKLTTLALFSITVQDKTSRINFGNIEFAGTGNSHIGCIGGLIVATHNYSITAGAAAHVNARSGGSYNFSSITITLTGTPAFSAAFVYGELNVSLISNGVTFSGGATGKRYDLNMLASVQTYGSGANYFPGNAAGTLLTGAQYN